MGICLYLTYHWQNYTKDYKVHYLSINYVGMLDYYNSLKPLNIVLDFWLNWNKEYFGLKYRRNLIMSSATKKKYVRAEVENDFSLPGNNQTIVRVC